MIKEDDGYGYCSLNPLDSSTSLWIGKYIFNDFFYLNFTIFLFIKDQGNPMNIPSLYSGALLDASTKTQPVEPVIYRPELKRSDKSYPYLRTPKFDSDWIYRMFFLFFFLLQNLTFFLLKFRTIIYCIV